MRAYIIILIMGLGFMLNTNVSENQTLKFSIDLIDTINTDMENIQIGLRIENITSEPINIKNPAHWGNVYPFVKQGGHEIPLIKVKINPEHFNDVIKLESHWVYEVEFDYTLDRILNLNSLPTGNYEIFFRLQSNPPVESNVFTFYKE